MADIGKVARKVAVSFINSSKDDVYGSIARKGIIGLDVAGNHDFDLFKEELEKYFFEKGYQGIKILEGNMGYRINVSWCLGHYQ